MTTKRLFQVLVASLALLFVALFVTTYLITGLLKTKSTQLATNKAQVEQLTTSQTSLAKSKRDIAKYADLEAVTKKIVPQDKDQAATVQEITNIAAASGVSLTTITFPSSTLGTTNTAKPGVVTAPSAAVPATNKPNLSQLTPVVNIPGVYNLQINVGNNANNTVTFAQLNAFLRGLESNRRTAAVSTINIQPQSSNRGNLIFTLAMNVYIKP